MSSAFSPEVWAEIDSRITDSNNLLYQIFLENSNAKNSVPQPSSGNVGVPVTAEIPSPTLPISSAPPMKQQYNMSLNFYPTQTNQLVAAPTYPNPIMSVPNSALTPNHFVTPPIGASMFGLPPNYGSAPIPQVAPIASTQVAPMGGVTK